MNKENSSTESEANESEKHLLQHILSVVNRLDERIQNLEKDSWKIEDIRSSIQEFMTRIDSIEKSIEKIYNHTNQMETQYKG